MWFKKIVKNKYLWIVIFVVSSILAILSSILNWDNRLTIAIGSVLLSSTIAVLIRPLLTKEKMDLVENVFVVLCSILLIATFIAYSLAPSDYDKSGVIQILAAVIGGFITLYGVGMTIKYNRLAKIEDEIKMAKPHVFSVGNETIKRLFSEKGKERSVEISDSLSTTVKVKKVAANYAFLSIAIANSDAATCTLKGFVLNDCDMIVLQYDYVMTKGSTNLFTLNYFFKYKEEIKSVDIILGDMLDNIYLAQTSFSTLSIKRTGAKEIVINGIKKIEMSKRDDLNCLKY